MAVIVAAVGDGETLYWHPKALSRVLTKLFFGLANFKREIRSSVTYNFRDSVEFVSMILQANQANYLFFRYS